MIFTILTMQVVHLADLHIGSDDNRFQEYSRVFLKVQQIIQSLPNKDKTIAIICGDIFHHKVHYTGEDVLLFDKIITYVADEIPCIVIPGNHDIAPSGNRVDLITPLIGKLNTVHPVHYLVKTAQYELYSLHITHINVLDTSFDISNFTFDSKLPTVLLYHGIITGAKFGGKVHSNPLFPKAFLDNFDYVFLGDVHEHQFINDHTAYPGSLIQQNLGETTIKGLILWNLSTKQHKFITVHNEVTMLRLDLRNLTEEQARVRINATVRPTNLLKLSVICDDTLSESTMNVITEKIGTISYVQRHNVARIDPTKNINAAIRALLLAENASEEMICEIIDMQNPTINYRKYAIKLLKWDNMFKYGSGNVIDFTNLAGLTGVIANNRSGKSSIIDIIVFALWGKLLRGDKRSMINTYAKNSRIEIIIEADRVYKIIRTDNTARHAKVRLLSYVDSVEVDETGTTMDHTYRKIRGIVGELSQFQLTNLFNDQQTDLIHMSSTNRVKYVLELFGITENAQKAVDTKKKITGLKKQITNLERPRPGDLVCPDTSVIKEERLIVSQQLNKISTYTTIPRNPDIIKQELQDIKIPELIECQPAPYAPQVNISVAESMNAKKSCRPSNVIVAELSMLPATSYVDIPTLTAQLSALPTSILRESVQPEISKLEWELSKIDGTQFEQLDNLMQLRKHGSAFHKDQIKELTFNAECGDCAINHDKISKAGTGDTLAVINFKIDTITQARLQHAALNTKLKQVTATESEIRKHNITCRKADELRERLVQQIKSGEQTNHIALQIRDKNKELMESKKIESALAKSKQYEAYKAHIAYANYLKTQTERDQALAKKSALESELATAVVEYPYFQQCELSTTTAKQLTERLSDIDKRLAVAEYQLSAYMESVQIAERYERDLIPLDRELKKQKLYLKVLTSQELINNIIGDGMRAIINCANAMLIGFGFTINMTLTDEMTFSIADDGKLSPVDLVSGVEKFVISLALRLALCQSLPLPTFMIIDEGFGVADESNMCKLKHALHEVASGFTFVFCISHATTLQNALVRPLTISHVNRQSHINNVTAPPVDSQIAANATPSNEYTCSCGKKIKQKRLAAHMKTKYHIERTR